jgi:Fe2+ transport system protein B
MSVNCKESKPKSKLNNLLDSSSSASSDDDDNSQSSSSNSLLKASNTANITSNIQQPVKKGIYSQVINQTKQNIRNTHSKFDRVDSNKNYNFLIFFSFL